MNREDEILALESSLEDEDRAMLEALAEGIERRHLTPAAVMFLESIKPLGFITSQVLYFFQPLVQTIWTNPLKYERLARLLERRGTIELLIRRLEARY
jgi:hypothetical protein